MANSSPSRNEQAPMPLADIRDLCRSFKLEHGANTKAYRGFTRLEYLLSALLAESPVPKFAARELGALGLAQSEIEARNAAPGEFAPSAGVRSDAASHGVLPDCMMPDGAEPCAAYQHLERELAAANERVNDWRVAYSKLTVESARSATQAIDGFAVVTADGAYVGIWREREVAEKIVNRSPSAKGETIVPMCRAERTSNGGERG